MNSKQLLFTICAVGVLISSFTLSLFHDHETLKIGAKAPMTDVKMKAVSGEEISLADAKKENGLLVIFSCNTCPFVIGGMGEGWEGRYNEVNAIAEANNIGVLLVNSNAAKREKGDSYEDMVSRAKDQSLESAYVIDEKSKLANSFGARTTPHVFLFNKEMELAYVGAIDDNVKSEKEVKHTYVKDALSQLGKNEDITTKTTRNVGCSIKRVAH